MKIYMYQNLEKLIVKLREEKARLSSVAVRKGCCCLCCRRDTGG